MSFETRFYAAKNKDSYILKKSSSGGAFDALARTVLDKGGAIVGVAFSEDKMSATYVMCNDINELNKLHGSKYIQANPNNIMKQIKEYIINSNGNNPILISGTPCHVEGIRKYLNELNLNLEKVYFCSLICHGVPSPKIWEEYMSLFFNINKPEQIYFKDKRNGWKKPIAVAITKEKEYSLQKYTNLFNNDLLLRPCCYKCKFATTERMCDITIGDYWGVENNLPDFYDKDGVSLIIVHSKNGLKLLNNSLVNLKIKEITKDKAMQPNLKRPSSKPFGRNKFWKYYIKHGLKRTIQINEIYFLFIRIKMKVKQILKK